MKLRDYLSVPYLLESYSVERAPDVWTRHVSYPELPDCYAEAEEVEVAIASLERARLRTVLRLLRGGATPPVPRQPLACCDPGGLSRELGMEDEITAYLDLDESELRAAPSVA